MKQVISTHKPKIKAKHQKLIMQTTKRRIPVFVDGNTISIAIDSLISNATTYTQEKGTITISYRLTAKSAYVDISDTGAGIAKLDIPYLFQKFSKPKYSSKNTTSGPGFGLYMAKYITEAHGGKIMVKSRRAYGSVFTIKLPLLTSNALN